MSFTTHTVASVDPDAPTCPLNYLRLRLGCRGYGDKRMVTYVTKLIEQFAFPPPLPLMRIRKDRLETGVTADSRWLRPAVDEWLHGFLLPAAAAGLDRAAQAAAAAEMDAAALSIGRPQLRVIGGGL